MYRCTHWTFARGGRERSSPVRRSGAATAIAALAAVLTAAGVSAAAAQSYEQSVNRWKQHQSQQMLRQSVEPVERSLRESGREIEDRTVRQSERLRLEGQLQRRTIRSGDLGR